jgi:predicted DNA-binding transcriptional regulator YafY
MFNQNRFLRVLQLIAVLKSKPPKTYKYLAEFLDASSRTVYRYLDLLTAVGIKVEKGPNFTYFIPEHDAARWVGDRFTKEEVEYLERVLLSSGGNNTLAKALVQKINFASVATAVVQDVFNGHLSKIIEDLSKAITDKRQVVLKQYQSASSQTIADRLVEPVAFTDDYASVGAFEVSSGLNKYFNIERIGRVEVLETPMAFGDKHAFHEPDVFGFQGSTLDKEVSFLLSLRAYLVFRKEYPKSIPFIEEIPEMKSFLFKAKVQDYQAPGRFVRGFSDQIEVLGSDGFLEYLKNQ